MKISKRQLRQIIKEEKRNLMKEMAPAPLTDVSRDLFHELLSIFRDAAAQGLTRERIAGIVQDAVRDFDDIGNQLDEDDEYSW